MEGRRVGEIQGSGAAPTGHATARARQLDQRGCDAGADRQARRAFLRRTRRAIAMAFDHADVVHLHQSGERTRAAAASAGLRALRTAAGTGIEQERLPGTAGRSGSESFALMTTGSLRVASGSASQTRFTKP